MSSRVTPEQLSDKKKLEKKIKKLKELISKGDSKTNMEGVNALYQKAYKALKDVKSVPLKKVHIGMFGDYGFLKAGGFYIAKSGKSFSLFKAREKEKISEKAKRSLRKKANDIVKDIKSEKELKKVVKDIPFLEWKPLAKGDIQARLYQEAKSDTKLYQAVASFMGKEKLLKKDFESLSFVEMGYLADHKAEMIKHTDFYKIISNYDIEEVKDTLQLDRKADDNTLSSEAFNEYKLRVDEIEREVHRLQNDMRNIREEVVKVENKSATLVSISMDLLSYRDELDKISSKIDKQMPDPEKKEVMEMLEQAQKRDDGRYVLGDMVYAQKEELRYSKKDDPDLSMMKIGLADSNKVVDYFIDKEDYQKQLGIEIENEIIVTNYGVFTNEDENKALINLLSYANSIYEMVQNNDKQEAKLQENSGNFAI